MNTPDDAADDHAHPLEALLAEALARLERDGLDAAERFVDAHPEHAVRLREALADLRQADLVGAPTGTPRAFGEFRILDKLGEGGMGVVHLAEQESLGRQVALKVVRPELLLFDGARERFRREIDAVARLEHPAIVPILATGAVDGVPWYAMPRLRGRSAEAVVRAFAGRDPRGLVGDDLRALLATPESDASDRSGFARRPWWFVVSKLVHDTALGIQHAHTRGVLHRDLKPSNVMLTADGRAVVLDFGLAQAQGDARLTRSGSAAGSPAYMAPEQVRGEGADERTDVYGLGALLHCLLGLQPPFDLDQPERLRQLILAGERRSLRPSGAPPELLLVVDTAMDVERSRRYPSAHAFADDLQAVLEQRPIAARRLPWHVRSRRFVARHRQFAAAVGAALLVAAAVPPILLWQQRAANDALAEQVQRADRSTAATLDAIDTLLGSVALPKLRNLPAVQNAVGALLDAALAQFARLADDPTHAHRVQELRRRTLFEIAQIAARLGNLQKGRAALVELLALAADVTAPHERLLRARGHRLLAWIELREGHVDDCATRLESARRDLDATFPKALANAAARELADISDLTGGVADARGDRMAVVQACRETVAILERTESAGAPSPELSSARLALGANLRDAGDATAARPLLESVLAATTVGSGDESGWPVPRLLRAMAAHELASLEYDQRRTTQVLDNTTQALGMFDELVRDYPHDLSVRRHRGRTANLHATALQAKARHAEARPWIERAIADQDFVLAATPDDRTAQRYLAQHYRTYGVCLRNLKDWPALERAARKLGTFPGDENTGRAARDLLRCASQLDGERHRQLADEALTMLEGAVADGMRLDPDDAVYAPVRELPRFRALLPSGR
ncbi:MAG: protein kinase [Planctomycetes bacterium]|nr:protein kinase [Planctomycetota bacterium]